MSLDVIVSGRRRQRAVTFNSSTSQPASPLSFHERTPQPVQTFWDMPASGTPATTSLSSIAPPLLGEEALVSARRRQRTSTTDSRTMAPGLSKHQSLQVLDTRRMRRQSTSTAIPTTPTPDALSLSLSSPSVPQQSSSLLSPRTAITPRYSASTPTLPLAQQQLALSQSDPFGSSASLPTALPSASTAALPYASTTSLPSPYTVSPFSTPFTPTNTPTIPFTPTNTPTSMPFSPAPPLTSSTPLAGLNDFTVSPSGLSLSAPPPSVQPVLAPTAALPSTLHFSDSALLDSSSGFSHSAVEVSKSFSSATPFKQADYPPSSPFPVPAQGSSFLPAFNSPTQTTPTTSPFVATTPSSSPFATPSQPSLPFAPPLQQVHSSPSAVPTFAIPTQTSFIAAPTQPAPSFVAPTSTASFAVPASISTPAFAVPTQASFSAVPAQASFMGPNPFASATAPPAFTVPTQASLAVPTQSSFALPTQASFASPSLGTPLASASSALLPAPPGPVPNDPLLAQIQQQIQNQTSLLSTMEASLMQQEQQLFELNRQKAMIAQKQATPLDHRTIQFAPHPFS